MKKVEWPSSKSWFAQHESATSITYIHERDGLVVLRQQLVSSCLSKASTLANQGIGHAATGSRNVRLHVHTSHSFRSKVRPQKTTFPCNLRNTFRELWMSKLPRSGLSWALRPMLKNKIWAYNSPYLAALPLRTTREEGRRQSAAPK